MFLVFRLFKPDLSEVTFAGADDPHTPVSSGWLRASQRKLDPKISTDFRPYHAHDEIWPLTPGEPVELDIPIWPTCIVIPKGYRLGLTIRGKDYEFQGASEMTPAHGIAGFIQTQQRHCSPHAQRSGRSSTRNIRRRSHSAFRQEL
jgi:predicted acyl esterase